MEIIKKYLKKINITIFAVLMIISQLITVHAIDLVIKPAEGNKIPAEYGTSFHTTGNYNITYSEHWKQNDLNNASITAKDFEKYVPHNILTSNNFGKIWWQYNDIATYEGKHISIKFTALSWDTSWKYPNGVNIAPTGGRYYLVARSTKSIGAFSPFNTRLKVEFLDSKTGKHIHIKGYLTAVDMDGKVSEASPEEKMTLHNGIDYVFTGSNLKINDQTISSTAPGATGSTDKTVQATICFNGTSFEYTYVNGAFTGFTNTALTEFEIPMPVKSVSKTQAVKGDSIEYKIKQFVPNESKEHYYKNFVISDEIPSILNWNINNVKILDEFDKDVSSLFDVKRTENTLTVTAKDTSLGSFYARTYHIIPTILNSNDLASITSEKGTFIQNQAILTTDRGSQTSNEVQTEITYNITTRITNGSITSSINDIKGGSNEIVTFTADEGYYISSIKVDGVEHNISDKDKGKVEFTNIIDNHVVEVVCSEKYHIDTQVINGLITKSVNGIMPNENKKIEYKANDGYYVAQVIVDGNVLSPKDYPSYTFSSINENHSIKVVCQPLKTIKTEIENGTITETITNIHPDENKKVIWEAYKDYYIESVSVDGQSITVKDFEKGNYEFKPVETDHTIQVVCKPKYVINTNVIEGTISPEAKFFPGESYSVNYAPKDSYHLVSVTVDGNQIDVKKYSESYTFSNIKENHDIQVVYEKNPALKLEKTTDDKEYNVGATVHYNLKLEQPVEDVIAKDVVITDKDMPEGLEINYDSITVSGIDLDDYEIEKLETGFIINVNQIAYNIPINISFSAVIDSQLEDKTVTNTAIAICEYGNEVSSSTTVKVLKTKSNIKLEGSDNSKEESNKNKISSKEIKKSNSVETSDTANIVLWGILMIICTLFTFLLMKKNQRSGNKM